MTRQRGQALIINNKNFVERPDLCRKGSDADVENMSAMLKSLKFDVETHTDRTAEVCCYGENRFLYIIVFLFFYQIFLKPVKYLMLRHTQT